MRGKLFVGNLAPDATSEDLQRLFATAGTVKWADVAKDTQTGRSKGFGFVEMGSSEEARRAVVAINGRAHQGRFLKVSESNPKGQKTPARPVRGKAGPGARRGFRASGR